jgi:hypothetical protein
MFEAHGMLAHKMNTGRIISTLSLIYVAGCAPVHIHQYLAHGILSPKGAGYSIGIRATTTADPNDPNSFGASDAPGATGFLLEFLGQSITTTVEVTNILGTYSHGLVLNDSLRLQPIGKEYPAHFYSVYAVPTGSLIRTSNPRIAQVLDYGTYDLRIEYNLNGIAHSSTGTVKYFHRSHWEIGAMGKGWN